MSDGPGSVDLAPVRDAAERGAWRLALDLFGTAPLDRLAADQLPLLGEVAYAAGDLDLAIATWERAYATNLEAGDTIAAAMAASRVAMHLLFDTALLAPVRGWLARADTLLDDRRETPAHVWHAVVRAYERMLSGDLDGAETWARQAIETGLSVDPAACALARVAAARLAVLGGRFHEGLQLLEEVGVAAVSGGLDRLTTGVVYCELVCALQGLGQYDAAEEWTHAMERWGRTNAIGSLHGRCRVHRAEILRLRGELDEAEAEVLEACDELRPYIRREMGWPLTELGTIRLHRGDLVGAEEALAAAQRLGWDPQPTLARVRLHQGDVDAASASVRKALEHPSWIPFKERPPDTGLQRAPLLELDVEIAVQVGDIDRARAAAEELATIAEKFPSRAMAASQALAEGWISLAEEQPSQAAQHVAEAVRLYSEMDGALPGGGRPHVARPSPRGRRRAAVSGTGARSGPGAPGTAHRRQARSNRGPRGHDEPPGSAHGRREGRVPPGGRLLVGGLRGAHGARARPQGHALPRPLARRARTGVPRARPRRGRERRPAPRRPAATVVGSVLGDAGELLDDQAKKAYRRRLTEVDDDLDEARRRGDERRAEQAQAEHEFLVRELSRAFGLDGRQRRAGSAPERARVAVTRAIRTALARISEHHETLGEHLDNAVRTGAYCSYQPDPRVPTRWTI